MSHGLQNGKLPKAFRSKSLSMLFPCPGKLLKAPRSQIRRRMILLGKYDLSFCEKCCLLIRFQHLIFLQRTFEAPEARDRAELTAFCNSASQSYQPLTRRAAAVQSNVLLPEEEHSVLSTISNPEEKSNTATLKEARQAKDKAKGQVMRIFLPQ